MKRAITFDDFDADDQGQGEEMKEKRSTTTGSYSKGEKSVCYTLAGSENSTQLKKTRLVRIATMKRVSNVNPLMNDHL